MLRVCFVLCLCCLTFLHPSQLPTSQAQEALSWDPNRLEVSVIASELLRPMELDVAADGTVYYIELEGDLKAIDPGASTFRLVGKLPVTTEQENGLIGLALDPNFVRNHWIYLQYSPPGFEGQFISRFTLTDGQLDLASEKKLYQYQEQRKQCCHHAGSLEFGPDGCLYIATGDNTNPFEDSQGYAPIDERPGREPWDAQRSSANSRSSNGKILRIRPLDDGTYEIPEGNLFPADGSKGLPEIYVMGCRNPWRISVDSETGFLYWGDVGPDAGADNERGTRGHDEVNQARQAGFFGWPYFNGNNRPYNDVNFETGKIGQPFDPLHPINDSPNNNGVKELPPVSPAFIYYPGANSEEFPELGSGGRTACAGPVFHFDPQRGLETQFPEALDKVLLIYEWSRHWVKLVHLDQDHKIQSIQDFMPGYSFVRPVDMVFGPEGSLYVLEYGETWGVNKDARLIRIDYIRGNRTPTAIAQASNNIGRHPLQVQLSGEGSGDRDQDPLSYQWRLIDTAQPTAESPIVADQKNATITIDKPGIYNAELTVTDPMGASRSATVPVVVGNTRPEIRFLSPQSGDFYDGSEAVDYQILVQDPEDGTNDDDLLDQDSWELLDVLSPNRTVVSVWQSTTPFATMDGSGDNDPPGMKMMKGSDCFNCHAVDQQRVGPKLVDIAQKYRDQPEALEASIQRVINGSTGVWGKIPMIPHSQHSPQEVREMVSWIFGLQSSGQVQIFKGFAGQIPSQPTSEQPVFFRLDANYTDLGHQDIPALTGTTSIFLRPRWVQAEAADQINGPSILNSSRASGGQFIGAINHGHTLRFANLNFDQIGTVILDLASAGAGGQVELRLEQPDGPILATVDVQVNGDWEDFYQRTVEIKTPDGQPVRGRHDLVIRFTHPGGAGGLMNLDCVRFQP